MKAAGTSNRFDTGTLKPVIGGGTPGRCGKLSVFGSLVTCQSHHTVSVALLVQLIWIECQEKPRAPTMCGVPGRSPQAAAAPVNEAVTSNAARPAACVFMIEPRNDGSRSLFL